MDRTLYNKFYDQCHARIKGSMLALTLEQKEQIVDEVYYEMGLQDNGLCRDMKDIFRHKPL